MVNEWTIYGNAGAAKAVVKELELHDEWMAECFITVTVKSAEPIDFAIGDYITYRDEKYSINYDPTIIKKARRESCGEGFVYDNIKFAHDAQNKVVTCDFTDIVLNDNNLHYTSLPTFPFFCESVDDLLDRIQACLEELYPGEFVIIGLNTDRNSQRGRLVNRQAAFEEAYREYVDPAGGSSTTPYGKQNVALTVDNITCWDAVTKIHEDFELNFIQRGYVIVAGTSGSLTPSTFRYGKGKGLYELERICDSSQQIVTRLRAYGNETNIPNRYYANLNTQCFGTVTKIEANYATSGLHYAVFLLDLDFASRLFNNRSVSYPGSGDTPNYIVEVRANDITVRGYVTKNYSSNNCYVYCEYTGPNPEDDRDETDESKMNAFSEAIKQGDTVYFVSYINKDAWPTDHKNTASENLPNNMAVNRLMLPGFPNQSLYDWVKANGGTNTDDESGLATINGFTGYFSKDKYRPYIDSLNRDDYGIRPASIYFDGSGDTTDIHPTIEEMTYGGSRIDVIVSADQITDNGVYDTSDPKNFKITLPNLGFELDEVYKDDASIDMKDGMCGARSFKLASRPKKLASGQWECTVQRAHDDSLDLWFPYKDFQIRPNDHYVLIGIDMPDAYVNAAAEKLFNAAIEALQKNDKPTYTYQPRIDEIWMQRQHDSSIGTAITSIHDTIKAGDIFAFEDEDLGIEGSIIIDVLTIKENGNNGLPTYEVTLRDEKQVSTIQKMIDKAVTSSNAGGSGSGNGGYTGKQVHDAIENYGSEYYLSKINDDEAQGEIGFLKGLWIAAKGLFGFDGEGNIKANEGNFSGRVIANDVRSNNYTGSGIADTGWAIVNDNGSGSSQAIFDYLTIRKKMIVNSLEIKETHVTAGDIAQTCASADIARTDYYEVDEQGNYTLLGYAKKKIPWYLKGMAMALGKRVVGSKWYRMFGHHKEIRVTLTAEDLSRCNRIRCYFLAKDGEKEIENWFRVNDLIRCQTWNIVKASRQTYTPNLNDHDGNIFWWRKCVNVSWNTGTPQYFDPNGNKTENESDAFVNEGGIKRLATNGTYSATVDDAHAPKELDGNTYHWFDVAYNYDEEQNAFTLGKDTGWCALDSDIPALGDKVVQFGNSTDPDRMNITLSEVNGSGNIDAPDIKMYRGVYTFNLERSWWGGITCKIKISPATGCDFYAPHFRFITETGSARVPFDRTEKYWTSIALERDEYHEAEGYDYPDYSDDIKDEEGNFVSRAGGSAESPIAKNYVRKCYYYDRVTHEGSLWLCSIANETWYWRATTDFGSYHRGDKVTDYASLTDVEKDLCEHVRSYTNQEPSVGAGDWTKQVDKGDPGSFLSRAFCRTNTDISSYHPQGGTTKTPIPTSTTKTEIIEGKPKEVVVSGITWSDGAPDGDAMLWSTTAWFYSDGTHSAWTAPAHETDTQTQDIEFSPSYYQPAAPYGDDASQKDSDTYKIQRHSQGWYDPNDTLPSGTSWSDMIWRAERQIKNGAYSGEWSVSRVKGENSVRLDIDNEMDMVQTDSTGKVTVARTLETIAHFYDGAGEVDISGNTITTSRNTTNQYASGKGKRLTWAFGTTDTISSPIEITITSPSFHGETYKAVFTVVPSLGQPIYQLKPSLSAINFSRTTTNTLTPDSRNLTISIVKVDGQSTSEVSLPSGYTMRYTTNGTIPTTSSTKWGTSNGASGISWSGSTMTIANSTTVETVTIAIFNASNVLIDRESVPIVKDGKNGKNSVRLALDNEHEDFLYSKSGLVSPSPSTGATSQIRLYDGNASKTYGTDFTASIDTSKSTGISTSSTSDYYAYITSAGVLTVKGISTDTALVVVKSTYGDTTYYAEFTANKTEQDKFDIVVKPNAIAINSSETWADKNIKISANCTSLNGSFTEKYELQNSASNGLRLYYAYVDSSGTVGTLSQVTSSMSNVSLSSNVFTFTFKETAKANSGIYFELRYYSSSSSYRMCDYETVEIAKTENGTSSFVSHVFKRQNTEPSKPSGGSYTSPVPSGWSDGVPDGTSMIWMSTRIFSSDGNAPQQDSWTTPQQMSDTADFDVEFSSVASPNPPSGHPNTNTQWSNAASSSTIWMATSECHNGVWSDWQVSKIKGEKGDDGKTIRVVEAFKNSISMPSKPTATSITDTTTDFGNGWGLTPINGKSIGSGTTANQFLPAYTYYKYSLTEQIYTSSEIDGSAGKVKSISFYNSTYANTRNIEVYLVNTSKSTFSSTTDWIVPSKSDLVFSGSVTFVNGTWNTISFNKHFAYSGGNLAVIINDVTGSYVTSNMQGYVFSASNQSLYAYRDTPSKYDALSPSSITGTRGSVKNQIRLGMGDVYVSVGTFVDNTITQEGWSDPVLFLGSNGESGSEGLSGCVVRTSEWKSGQEYHNDEGDDTLEIRYLDVVAVVANNDDGYNFYRCKVTHTSSDSVTYADTTKWEALSHVGPIYTSLLVAKNAYIKFGTGNQFVITDSSSTPKIQAGMKGDGDIRIWAGASPNASSMKHDGTSNDGLINTAPFRVDKDGKLYATGVDITGKVTATSGEFDNGTINNITATNINIKGSTRSPFTFVSDNGTFNDQFTDNMSVRSTTRTATTYNIPWDTSQSGKKITITNWKDWNGVESDSEGYAQISAPSGKYFFEDGIQKSKLRLSREAVELIGYGNDDVFFGWAVLKRIDLGTQNRYGHYMKMLAAGTVKVASTDDHTPSFVKKETFDGTTLSVSRLDVGIYKVTWNNNSWFSISNDVFAMVCGYGTVDGVASNGPIYASVKESTTTSITVQVADDDSRNDGGFSFFLLNLGDWIYLHD